MSIIESEFPCYYIDSDKASKSAQDLYKGITYCALGLLFLSTILSSISTEVTLSILFFQKINGFILCVSGLTSVFLTFKRPESKWYLGRAIAESIKTLSWRYMMHSEPFFEFNESMDIINFTERLDSINQQANKDQFIPKPNKLHSDIITQKMKDIRSLNFEERKSFYAKYRIDNQIEWYGNKSERNRFFANICSFLIITFQFFAGIYLLAFFNEIKNFDVNSVLIFLTTSLIGVVELNKFKELHQSYAFTKQELNLIRARFGLVNDNDSFNQFVIEAEQAISREHTMWLARRGNAI